jgi:hypothetical protein
MDNNIKEEGYRLVQKAIELCVVENSHHSAVIVSVDNVENTVKIYGLNLDGHNIPELLIEAASNVIAHEKQLKNRTLN